MCPSACVINALFPVDIRQSQTMSAAAPSDNRTRKASHDDCFIATLMLTSIGSDCCNNRYMAPSYVYDLAYIAIAVSYTHLTLPTNREV